MTGVTNKYSGFKLAGRGCSYKILLHFFVFLEVGHFTHSCENDLVCKTTLEKIPYFNAPIFFENKEQIGKIDEIFGSLNDHVCFNYFNDITTKL